MAETDPTIELSDCPFCNHGVKLVLGPTSPDDERRRLWAVKCEGCGTVATPKPLAEDTRSQWELGAMRVATENLRILVDLARGDEPSEQTPEDEAADALVFALALKAELTAEGALSIMAVQAHGRKAARRHQLALYELAVSGGPCVQVVVAEWAALASFARRRGLFEEG